MKIQKQKCDKVSQIWVQYPFKEFCFYDIGANLEESRRLSAALKKEGYDSIKRHLRYTVEDKRISSTLPDHVIKYPIAHYHSKYQMDFYKRLLELRSESILEFKPSDFGFFLFNEKDLADVGRIEAVPFRRGEKKDYKATKAQVDYLMGFGYGYVQEELEALSRAEARDLIRSGINVPATQTASQKFAKEKLIRRKSQVSLYRGAFGEDPPIGWSIKQLSARSDDLISVPPWLLHELEGMDRKQIVDLLKKKNVGWSKDNFDLSLKHQKSHSKTL